MREADVSMALATSMDAVLEQMFFVTGLAPVDGSEPAEPSRVKTQVRFDGEVSGRIEVEVGARAAAVMAADFLAADPAELTAAQVEDVVLELSNMLCGAALSRMEAGSALRLSAPQVMGLDESGGPPAAAERSVNVGEGVVTARFHFETPCPA